jgi:hypothetical protein
MLEFILKIFLVLGIGFNEINSDNIDVATLDTMKSSEEFKNLGGEEEFRKIFENNNCSDGVIITDMIDPHN